MFTCKNLLTEWRYNPSGIETNKPRFSWSMESPELQDYQTAYQILVSKTRDDIMGLRDNVWDSGKVCSRQSANVDYGGKQLEPGTVYFWTIRTWNKKDTDSPYAQSASFITALWNTWQAQWIWSSSRAENQHIYLRKVIQPFSKGIVRVLAFISADDYYKFYINGDFAGQGPAPSYPDKEYNYNILDLTPHWKNGQANCLAAHAYYQGLTNWRWVSGDQRNGFICQVKFFFSDGTSRVVITDPTWRVKTSEAYSADHKHGYDTDFNENIDVRKIPINWNHADFDGSNWEAAAIQDAGQWKLHAQETDMLTIYECFPEELLEKEKGHYFFSFDREIIGHLSVKLAGKAGQKVEIRMGEELEPQKHNSVKYEMRCGCLYQDFWTLRDGLQAPEYYDYRGFRFGEIVGAPSKLEKKSIKAFVRHYPFDEKASNFTCSSPDLNALWQLDKYTVKMGTQEVYLDCPTREKAQYGIDAYMQMLDSFYVAGEWNFGRRMVEFFLQSINKDDKPCGIAPSGKPINFTEDLMYPIFMAWTYYWYTGDKGFIEKNYCEMTRVENYFRTGYLRPDGLLQTHKRGQNDMVDWICLDGHEMLPVNIAVNSVFYRLEIILSELSMIIGKEEDSLKFADVARRVKQGINDKLWDKANKRYVDGMEPDGMVSKHSSLHANVFPLAMDIIPPERVEDVICLIKTRGLKGSPFSAIFLFEALYTYGEGAYAYDLLTSAGIESPLNMLRKGATTTWETWDISQKGNISLFHPPCAFTSYILAGHLMGIKPLKPGYEKILINPQIGKLKEGSIKVPTIKGAIEYSFKFNGHAYAINLCIPFNTTARFEMKDSRGKKYIKDEIGSGRYNFIINV